MSSETLFGILTFLRAAAIVAIVVMVAYRVATAHEKRVTKIGTHVTIGIVSFFATLVAAWTPTLSALLMAFAVGVGVPLVAASLRWLLQWDSHRQQQRQRQQLEG